MLINCRIDLSSLDTSVDAERISVKAAVISDVHERVEVGLKARENKVYNNSLPANGQINNHLFKAFSFAFQQGHSSSHAWQLAQHINDAMIHVS